MIELEAFYIDLCDGGTCVDTGSFSSFLSDLNEIPSFVEEKQNVCEGKLGYGKCYNALRTFQKNKSPGNDGLTVEFYLAFWRPISLINVDAKIASKTLAKRLENMLPKIIHFDQSAFVKGRTILDAIKTIDDVIEHSMNRDISGILVAMDLRKHFDSLNFNFLLRVLHAFNFGPSFIQWVRVLYNKASSCEMNNGFTSGPFSLSRRVRQGDPLSPYLFILALEILTIKI